MSFCDRAARRTSRIASVEITLVIPNRAASCVAIVDLPTPVAPPSRMIRGWSSSSTACHCRYVLAWRSSISASSEAAR